MLVRAGRLAGALLSSGSRSGHFKLPWRSCCGIYTRAHRSFFMWRDGQLSLNVGHGYLVCTRRHPHKKGRPPLYVGMGVEGADRKHERTESTDAHHKSTSSRRSNFLSKGSKRARRAFQQLAVPLRPLFLPCAASRTPRLVGAVVRSATQQRSKTAIY